MPAGLNAIARKNFLNSEVFLASILVPLKVKQTHELVKWKDDQFEKVAQQ